MNTMLVSEKYVLPQQREQDTEVWMPASPSFIPLQATADILKVPMGWKKKQEVNTADPLTHASAWHLQDCLVCSPQCLHLNSGFPMFSPMYSGCFYILFCSFHQSHLFRNSFVVYMPLLSSLPYLEVISILKPKMLNLMLWFTPKMYIKCHFMLHLHNLIYYLYLIQKYFEMKQLLIEPKFRFPYNWLGMETTPADASNQATKSACRYLPPCKF